MHNANARGRSKRGVEPAAASKPSLDGTHKPLSTLDFNIGAYSALMMRLRVAGADEVSSLRQRPVPNVRGNPRTPSHVVIIIIIIIIKC